MNSVKHRVAESPYKYWHFETLKTSRK